MRVKAHTERAMSEDQFDKLFRYMQQQFGELRSEMGERFNEVNRKIDGLYENFDTVIKHQETEATERAAIISQLDQHDSWIHQLADNSHFELSRD